MRLSSAILLMMLMGIVTIRTEAQRLVRSEPSSGAMNVPVDIGEIRFHFDCAMNTGGWSFLKSRQGAFPPPRGDNRMPWADSQCCRLRLGRLEPGTTYAVQLNSERKRGFRSARTGTPLPVSVVVFTTAAARTEISGDDGWHRQQVQRRKESTASRPPCPEGWQSFNNEFLGFQAYVPPGFFARMRGRSILSVERTNGNPTAAFMTPIMPRGKTTAGRIATLFIKVSSRLDTNYRARILEGGTDTRTYAAFTTNIAGQRVEGKFLAIMTAGGSMAFVMGVVAPEGRLRSELPLLSKIVQGFGFTLPKGRWARYRSPGNNVTLEVPRGWSVVTSEGRVAKNEIDWEAYDPRNPGARAFSVTPKFCTQNMMSLPLYAMRGYKVAVFNSPRQCAQASINQIYQGARITSVKPNPVLTKICKQLFGSLTRNLGNLQAGGFDVAVFDCLAETRSRSGVVQIAFCCAISQLVLGGGITGQHVQTDVWCKGWCAPRDQFLSVSPVLDRIQDSMKYTTRYIQRVHNAEAGRAKKLQDTWDQMNKIDKEMNQKHWETQDAISEMYGDHWSEMGGYVNRNTGQIEKFDPDKIVKNSSGEIVSLEEVAKGVSPDDATVLRDAYSNDYMRGMYGRTVFVP